MPSPIHPRSAAAAHVAGLGWLDAAVPAILAHRSRVPGRYCQAVGPVPASFASLVEPAGEAQALLVAVEPHASELAGIAALVAPGGEILILAGIATAAQTIRQLLTASPLVLLRTELLDQPGMIIVAIRPEAAQAA
jgi:hypothetical protein